jgi:predicted transcriptional regulator
MDQKEFLSRLGFSDNPFQFTNADEEDHLQAYFIPPPYFHSVWGDPKIPQSHVIFAPRGGGKSAQRRMIEYKALAENVFAITYDRFENLDGLRLKNLSIEYHITNIIRLATIGFLLEFHSRGLQASAFTKQEREQIEELCNRYLGTISQLEALKALDSLKTLSAKAKQLLRDWSGPLSALFSTALASAGLPGGVKLGSETIPKSKEQATDARCKAHLEIIRDFIKGIGFESLYVLIDKVDETPQTGNNAEDSFLLMKPLLRDLELLQLRGIGFKFFLWDKLEPHHRDFARADRIPQFALSWSGTELRTMLSRRLAAFSNGSVEDLGQLTDAELADPLHSSVVLFANRSPRDMIRVCQEILSEQLRMDPESKKIGIDAVLEGITKFSAKRSQELLPAHIIRELLKVGKVEFTTNYIANNVFKIEVNSARNKIRLWEQMGVVERIGEIHTGGRPVFNYAVSDIRVARAMLSQLGLAEFIGKKLANCKNCDAVLTRDWDHSPTGTCHLCGSETGKPQKS